MNRPDLRDPEVRALLKAMHEVDPGAFRFATLEEARATLSRRVALRRGLLYEPAVVGVVSDSDLGNVPVRVYQPLGAALATLVWFHGGGWRLGGVETHDAILRRACRELSAVVVSVEYRLAPEHRFPAALDDGLAVIAALQDGNSDAAAGPIVIGGDSSGGQMAASLAVDLGAEGRQVAGLALAYPALDATMKGDSYVRHASGGGLTTAGLKDAWDALLQGHDPTDPRVSPLLAPDLSTMPPTVILNGGIDPVVDDGLELHHRLLEAGVRSNRRVVEGLIHAFMGMDGTVSRADRAVKVFWADVAELMT